MWASVKRWWAGTPVPIRGWHEAGPGNPFGLRVFDCRPMTTNVVATTEDPKIAEQYVRLRASDGRDLIARPIGDAVRIPASLRFPHNGAPLEGVVFKSDEMEAKWDIYIYQSVFLFARSWTGELRFRAWASIGPDEIRVSQIECDKAERELAADHVFFLIASHAMGRVLPHRVPCKPTDEPATIGSVSFSLFGRFAWFAAFDDITSIPLSRPTQGPTPEGSGAGP